MCKDLLSGTGKEGGVCLIDKDDGSRLGGGKLQDYDINSNTYASKFATNVVNPIPTNIPPESVSDTILESLMLTGYHYNYNYLFLLLNTNKYT